MQMQAKLTVTELKRRREARKTLAGGEYSWPEILLLYELEPVRWGDEPYSRWFGAVKRRFQKFGSALTTIVPSTDNRVMFDHLPGQDVSEHKAVQLYRKIVDDVFSVLDPNDDGYSVPASLEFRFARHDIYRGEPCASVLAWVAPEIANTGILVKSRGDTFRLMSSDWVIFPELFWPAAKVVLREHNGPGGPSVVYDLGDVPLEAVMMRVGEHGKRSRRNVADAVVRSIKADLRLGLDQIQVAQKYGLEEGLVREIASKKIYEDVR